MAMTSFTWFAWGPTLMDLVELFLYTRKIEITPWSSKEQFMSLLSGCLKPSSYHLPIVIYLSSFFYFPIKIKGIIFCPYFLGVWSPSSSPLPIEIHLCLFLISPWRLKEEFLSLFFEYERSPPSLNEKWLHNQVSHKTLSGSQKWTI